MSKEATCKQRWTAHKNDRVRDLRKLWKLYAKDSEAYDDDLGNLYEYGLGFDYVPPTTFGDGQREGYWRYQLSWGGPSDEFRFYSSGPEWMPYRITYTFLDWYDGHARTLVGKDDELLREIWEWFAEGGSTRSAYDKALET